LKIECHGQVGVYDSPRPGGVVVGVIGDQIIDEVLCIARHQRNANNEDAA
jgi:hypothetical protein